MAASTATSTSGSHELPPPIAFHLDIVASELSSAAHIAGHQSAADVIAQLGRWYPGDQLQLHDHLWLAFGHPGEEGSAAVTEECNCTWSGICYCTARRAYQPCMVVFHLQPLPRFPVLTPHVHLQSGT